MSDNTNDTNSEISERPERLFKPGSDSPPSSGGGGPSVSLGPLSISTGGGAGSGGPGELVEIGKHDLSTESKQTLGDFLTRVTAGSAGSSPKPNVFQVKPGVAEFSLTDPSTGLPAPQGNDQTDDGNPEDIIQTGTTIGSFTSTVDPEAKARFDSLSSGDFNGAEELPYLVSKEAKNGQIFGHTVHSGIEAKHSTSTRPGAPSTFPVEGPEMQQRISRILMTNRFNPTPNTPFMIDNSTSGSMGYTKQTELGRYSQNQDAVLLTDIRHIGQQMVVASTGHDPDLDDTEIANVLPTLEQVSGLNILDTQDLRVFNLPAGATVSENKGELIIGESDNKSYGSLSSPLEPFADGFPAGMFVNTVASMAALILSARAFVELANLFKKSDAEAQKAISAANPGQLKKGRNDLKAASLHTSLMEILNVPKLEYDFAECMYYGLLTFFGVDDLPAEPGDDFNITELVQSAQHVAGSPGYYSVVTRHVLRDTDNIIHSIKEIPKGPGALLEITKMVDTLTRSSTWRFLMQMAKLGNQVKMGDSGHPRMDMGDVDAYVETAATRVMMSRAGVAENNPAFYPGSQSSNRLAWRHASSPSRYLMPETFVAAASGVTNDADLLSEKLYMSQGGAAAEADSKSKSNLGSGANGPFSKHGPSDTGTRLNSDYVEFIENELEAEYMPFYFHDLRTNEIISFHAFLGGYTDGFSTDYTSTSAYGRSDDVMIYNKTTRSISFDFTVAATSTQDLDVMYWNVNKLISMCYPQWSRGRKMTNPDGDNFIQPFSQIPTASPMIRVRIGDMLKSNYSKFGLMRNFGLGLPASEFNINQATNNQAKNEQLRAQARIEAAKEMVIVEGNKTMQSITAGEQETDISHPKYGYAVGDLVLLDPTPTKYWPRTSDGKMGKEQNPSIGPSAKEGRLHTYQTPVEVEVIKRVPGPKNNPSAFDDALKKVTKHPELDPGVGEMSYLVKIKQVSPAHMSLGFDIDPAFMHHRAEHSEIIGLSDKGRKRIKDLIIKKKEEEIGEPEPDMTGPERLQKFFDADKNFIVRSFESSRGRGLAGFITGLNFDWAESTWEINPGRRAPKMMKLSVSFAPIHDMHLGLDHSGMMTSVPFNVGLLSNAINGDPYSDEYPSNDHFIGSQNKTEANRVGRGLPPTEPDTAENAQRIAEDAKSGNEG